LVAGALAVFLALALRVEAFFAVFFVVVFFAVMIMLLLKRGWGGQSWKRFSSAR
jgi:hypothetical protein